MNWQSLLLFCTGVLLLAVAVSGNPETIWHFAREDGPLENLTALAYFIGMLACLTAIYLRHHVRIAIVWALLCLLFLGEEVSWFQRVFGYSVPAVEAMNAQGEFNLHNLSLSNEVGRRFFDESGQFSFDLQKLLHSQNIFRAGFFLYFLVLPLLYGASTVARRLADWWGYVRPANGFIVATWLVVVTSFGFAVIVPELTRNAVAEVREFYYALVICLYTFTLAGPTRFAALIWSGQQSPAHRPATDSFDIPEHGTMARS